MHAEPSQSSDAQSPTRAAVLAVVACARWGLGLLVLFACAQVPVGTVQGEVWAVDTRRPVGGVDLLLTPAKPSPSEESETVPVDDNGRFCLQQVPAGDYFLSGEGQTYQLPPVRLTVAEGRVTRVALEMSPSEPFLEAYVPQRVFVPGEIVQFTANGFCQEETLGIEVYAVDPMRVMRDAGGSLWRVLAPTSPQQEFHPERKLALSRVPGLKPVARFRVTPSRDADHSFAQRVTLPVSQPGLYVFSCRADHLERIEWLMLTEIGLVTKCSDNSGLVYAVNLATGHPQPGVDLQIYTDGKTVPLGVTDENGIASFRCAGGSDWSLLCGRLGRSLAFVWMEPKTGSSEPPLRVFLFTDRPIYRPGAKVRFKGITRLARTEGLSVPGQSAARVEVRDPRQALVYSGVHVTNDFGSLDGEFTISPEAPTGDYVFSMEMLGKRYEQTFAVAAYRKPEFRVDVRPDRATLTRGETGWATVEARYFFGAPVVGARVDYTVQRRSLWWQGPSEESLLLEDTGDGEVVTWGDGRTDAQGRCRIRFETAPERDLSAGESTLDLLSDYDCRYVIDATVQDQGGTSAIGTEQVKVWRGEFSLDVAPERFVTRVGEEIPVTAWVRDHSDSSLSDVPVEIRLVRRLWNNETLHLASVEKRRGKSDREGRFRATVRAPSPGDYRVEAVSRDGRGNQIRAASEIWVTDRDGTASVARAPSLDVVSDQRAYQPGDTATFLINTSDPGGTALVTVERNGVRQRKLVPLKKNSTALRLPVAREWLPGFTLSVCRVREKEFVQHDVPVHVASGSRRLRVEVVPDHEEVVPGQKVRYRILVRDPEGKPVQAEVTLAIVDESVYAIQEDHSDILRALYAEAESEVETGFSFPPVYLSGDGKSGTLQTVRKEFPDTALWVPALRTNARGEADVTWTVPDSLTTWRATARAHTRDTLVGQAISRVTCRKPLMLRLQAPRFFTSRDRATLVALVHNESGVGTRARVSLEAQGIQLEQGSELALTLEPGQVKKVRWNVRAEKAGECRLVARVQTESGLRDGVEIRLPVLPHGRVSLENRAGTIAGTGTVEEHFFARQDAGSSLAVSVRLAPSLASGMLGALSYLASYPYGCTEQTMSAFLPDLLVYRTLSHIGARSPDVKRRLQTELPKMVSAGLQRLYRYQHYDGGWGWWEYDSSDLGMTAYVVEGLVLAKKAGYPVDESALAGGLEWLRRAERRLLVATAGVPAGRVQTLLADARSAPFGALAIAFARLAEKSRFPAMTRARAAALHALAYAGETGPARLVAGVQGRKLLPLSDTVTLAHLVLAMHFAGENDCAEWLCESLCGIANENGGLCHWEQDPEATALALRAILAVPGNAQPGRLDLARKAARWLLSQRDGTYWVSTQATARVLAALVDYLAATGETSPRFRVTLSVNGKTLPPVSFDAQSVYAPERVVALPASAMRPGQNLLRFQKEGPGTLYYTLQLRQVLEQEEVPVLMGSADLTVIRKYHRLQVKRDVRSGQYVLQPSREPVAHFRAGESYLGRVEIQSGRAYEHVVIEEPLPAGCEPLVHPRSDAEEWNQWWTDSDVRDHQVAFFARRLEKGTHDVDYHFRASVPGDYHVMPTLVQGMYDPRIRAGGAESRVRVR